MSYTNFIFLININRNLYIAWMIMIVELMNSDFCIIERSEEC